MTTGLRERKKQTTRELLESVALRLFEDQGYEGTTVEQIAQVAEVSPRTFTRYFGFKEEVLFGYEEEETERLLQAVRERLRPRLDLASLTEALVEFAEYIEEHRDSVVARGRIIASSRTLRMRGFEVLVSWRDGLAFELAREARSRIGHLRVQTLAATLIAVLDTSMETWLRRDCDEPLPDLVRQSAALLREAAT